MVFKALAVAVEQVQQGQVEAPLHQTEKPVTVVLEQQVQFLVLVLPMLVAVVAAILGMLDTEEAQALVVLAVVALVELVVVALEMLQLQTLAAAVGAGQMFLWLLAVQAALE